MVSPARAAATDSNLIFTNSSFAGFDAIRHIEQNHPDLSQHAETISHWSGYYSVNPILAAELLNGSKIKNTLRPNIIRDVVEIIALPSATGLTRNEAIARQLGITKNTVDALISISDQKTLSLGRGINSATTQNNASTGPPALDLPFASPQACQFNGIHTWTGDDENPPMSSIDFTRDWSQRWGDDTSTDFVSAAHDGMVTYYSSCFVEVNHPSGWATRYYHLDEVTVGPGQNVLAGEVLGIYANELDQATCSGGHSTGPHLHFALLKDGQYHNIDGQALSGYQLQAGDYSYDASRERMWIDKRGTRYFAFDLQINHETGDNRIDYRYNGMWYSPDANGHGVNIDISEFPQGDGTRHSMFIVVYTYDDDGQANFYVGALDFERWRSDESKTIELLQTSGGDFSNLRPVDFDDPDQVRVAGEAELRFVNCNEAELNLDLDERTSGQGTAHSINLVKLIGNPAHVCNAAALAPE